MAKMRAKLLFVCLCGLLFALGAETAWAGGLRLGLGRLFLPPVFFGGPPFGGPRVYEVGPEHEAPIIEHRAHGREWSPKGPRKCYSSAETRRRIARNKLREPFPLMRKAAALTRAEALAVKLCSWEKLEIYEISLLRRDGRIVHVYMNAETGKVIGAHKFH